MYKALVRSHLDYYDKIYQIPSRQTQLDDTLNALMEKTERIQYQAAPVHGKVHVARSDMRN